MAKKKDQEEVSEGQKTAPTGAEDPPVQPEAGAATADGPCASAEDRITALEAETADLKDKLLRKQAEFENFRKRMMREREEAARYSNASLLTDILGLIDDFERALRSAEESKDFANFVKGVGMVERQFLETLESRWGLKRFTAAGESFDPNRHEAVLRVEGPADAKPTVVEEFQKGFYLHERVLRPARVKVLVPGSAPAEPASPAGTPPSADA
jgi:molecular chaperone GrpE